MKEEKKAKKPKKKNITISMDESLILKGKADAEKQGRSFSNYISYLISIQQA